MYLIHFWVRHGVGVRKETCAVTSRPDHPECGVTTVPWLGHLLLSRPGRDRFLPDHRAPLQLVRLPARLLAATHCPGLPGPLHLRRPVAIRYRTPGRLARPHLRRLRRSR